MINFIRLHSILVVALLTIAGPAISEAPNRKALRSLTQVAKPNREAVNKLLYMYRLYYLPFSLFFHQGKDANEIVPFIDKGPQGISKRMLDAKELETLNSEWDEIRTGWKRRSLFLNTQLDLNKSKNITSGLIMHHIPISRRAFDGIPFTERIKMNELLKLKSAEIQADFKQLRFVKSFIPQTNPKPHHLFVFSASWCESCLEYRALLESYFKRFPKNTLTLHSVVIEDKKESIFDSQILKELFPHPQKYSHESIPRFLVLDRSDDKAPKIYEEGEALKFVYDRYLEKHRGFLNLKSTVFKTLSPKPRSLSTDRK